MNRTVATMLLILSFGLVLGSHAYAEAPLYAGDEIEVKLVSGKTLSGSLLNFDASEVLIATGNQWPESSRHLRAGDIVGIRHRESGEFLALGEWQWLGVRPQQTEQRPLSRAHVIRVKTYDLLPFMALAIAGGVYAGDRFSKAGSESDLASSLHILGEYQKAREFDDLSNTHTTQGYVAALVAAAAFVVACIPTYEEIPLQVSITGEDSIYGLAVPIGRSSGGGAKRAESELKLGLRFPVASAVESSNPHLYQTVALCVRW